MEIIIHPDAQTGCLYASKLISNLIKQKPNAVLGLATGGTPIPVYQSLIQKHQEEGLDFSKVRSFNLDEYVGVAPSHSASYHYYMKNHLFDHINILPENAKVPNGLALDIEAHCNDYEAQIKQSGGLDLQLLGIGGEGHIGFNEPSSSLASRTRIKTLIQRTRDDNKKFFQPGENVPEHVLTMGIATIMEAKTIVMLAFGASKSEAVARSLEGPITARIPASILQMHPKTIVILDDAAASKLEMRDYYRHVYKHKCEWQRV